MGASAALLRLAEQWAGLVAHNAHAFCMAFVRSLGHG